MPDIKKQERPLTKVELLFATGFEQGRERNLKEQYKTQVKALYEVGVLELMTDGNNIGYVDIKGKERPLPSYDEFVRILEVNYESVAEKFKQGFTNVRLDLIGLPLDFIFKLVPMEILKAKKEGRLKGTDGSDLDLNTDNPFYIDDSLKGADVSGDLLYGPSKISNEGQEGGMTKEEYLEVHPSGYILRLDENNPDLPAEGKGKTVGGRKQLEANQQPIQYSEELQANAESGETIDSQALNFLVNLKLGKVIDDYQGNGKVNWLTGNFLKSRRGVPFWDWDRDYRQARLFWNYPDSRNADRGCRASAVIH